MALTVVLVLLVSAGASFVVYRPLDRLGRMRWAPAISRGIGWSALGLLLVNLACPAQDAARRPVVLLDGSLSMTAVGGRWSEALAFAQSAGDVRLFGDEALATTGDSNQVAEAGRSRLGPALASAVASGRPILVVTDGEIEDASDLPRDLLAVAGVRLLRRSDTTGVAVTRVAGPQRLTAGDTLRLAVEVQAVGRPDLGEVPLVVRLNGRDLLQSSVTLGSSGLGRTELMGPVTLPPGDHALEISLAENLDSELRDNTRLHRLTVTATPGVVLIADPADWEGRFLLRVLREVSALPVRGYAALEPGRYRTMGTLAPVATDEVERAARGADLLVVLGNGAVLATRSRARAIMQWSAPAEESSRLDGDWYLSAAGGSPIAGAFAGFQLDSLPPARWLARLEPTERDWVGLTGQLGRRGATRPAVLGREEPGRRRVLVGVGGLWRWAFRGGTSEQAYRAWVAASVNWLLAAPDTGRGVAIPLRSVVERGRPVVFAWQRDSLPVPVPLTVSPLAGGPPRRDTLTFDGSGHAEMRLEPGVYRYEIESGGAGTLAVEEYSPEWLPHLLRLTDRTAGEPTGGRQRPVRDQLWLFGLAVIAFCGEWFFRRRLGLR